MIPNTANYSPQLSELMLTLATHTTEVRCGLVGLRIPDLIGNSTLDCRDIQSEDPSKDSEL